MAKLTSRQQRFVDEYLVDCNATQAAIRAGYAPKDADVQGPRLLGNVGIRQAIDAAMAARSERTQITADAVLREYALIAFSDLGLILDFTKADPTLRPADEIPAGARRALQSVKVKRVFEGDEKSSPVDVVEFRLWSKTDALEKLGKHLKMFTDKVELSIPELDRLIELELARLAASGEGRAPQAPAGDAVACGTEGAGPPAVVPPAGPPEAGV